MTRQVFSACTLACVFALAGCKPSADKAVPQHSGPAAPDFTSVHLWPGDMVTHAARVLEWDEAQSKPVAGRVDLQIRFYNYTRPPSEQEIQDVVARTELLTWPEVQTIAFTTKVGGPKNRTSSTLEIVPAQPLQDGWYALRIAEREGFVEHGADPGATGRGQRSRFHVGSCPLVLGMETSDSGQTRLVLSETLDGSALKSLGIASLDGARQCTPRFSTASGPLSPGKKLDFDCDFNPATNGAKVTRGPKSRIRTPKGPQFRAEAFKESRGRLKTNRLTLSTTEAMPDCR